jgi:hypothetical protein
MQEFRCSTAKETEQPRNPHRICICTHMHTHIRSDSMDCGPGLHKIFYDHKSRRMRWADHAAGMGGRGRAECVQKDGC